ncbi:MAG: hypothetical protein WC344_02415 [Bacilli bacterium]
MNWVDIAILLVVLALLSLIIYFGLIKNREKGGCRNCPEANGAKANRLLRDYRRKFRIKK